ILARLRAAHPRLVVELVLSNEVEDLLRRDADIAVRMVRPTQAALVARRAGGIEVGLHAHPAYLAAHGTPRTLAELSAHAIVGFDRETPLVRRVLQAYPMLGRAGLAFRADSDLAQLAAIRAGLGIGFCQAALAARDGLVRVLRSRVEVVLDTWIAMHEDLRDNPRCAVAFAALAEGISAHARSRAVGRTGKAS
ncbi:MAG TPA: LysR substrate-binding domain-containing protein, partial [Burkholderiaceae bacterium]